MSHAIRHLDYHCSVSERTILKDINSFAYDPQEKSALEIFKRLIEIDYALRDYFISWEQTKRLLQEQTELIDLLKKLGYEP